MQITHRWLKYARCLWQYVAELFGYMPADIGDRARVVMICDHIYEDLVINIAYCIWNMREWDRDCLGGFAGPQVRSSTHVCVKVANQGCQPRLPTKVANQDCLLTL
jgi:hypothetical protein